MVGVIPIGILTEKPEDSRAFYTRVMGLERVLTLRNNYGPEMGGTVLRLESPQVELASTEFRVLDRPVNQIVRREHRMILRPRDLGALLNRLAAEGIKPLTGPMGELSFEDLNGLHWEIRLAHNAILDQPVLPATLAA